MNARLALAGLLALPAACAGPAGEPPSLAPRPIEGVVDQPIRAIAPVPSAEDPALAERIAALVGEAEQGQAAFAGALPAARAAIAAARGAAAESEAWVRAHLELSALDNSRGATTTALGALDAILAGQALTGEPAETERLLAARERVGALHAGQAATLDALAAGLRSY